MIDLVSVCRLVELPEWTQAGFCLVIDQSEDGENVWKTKTFTDFCGGGEGGGGCGEAFC